MYRYSRVCARGARVRVWWAEGGSVKGQILIFYALSYASESYRRHAC